MIRTFFYQSLVLALISGFALFYSGCGTRSADNGSGLPEFVESPKNIILMIGDGMGLSQISAGLIDNNNSFSLEAFPVIGFHKSYSYTHLITDSGAGATAFACGLKTYNNAIGMDKDTMPCKTILEMSEEQGLSTGMIATSSISNATPASFIAHQEMRTQNEDIAADFLKTEVDFVVGGGKKYFDRREDGQNIYKALENKGYLVDNYFNSDLKDYFNIKTKRNFVFFTADGKPTSADMGRTYLPMATQMGIHFLEGRSEKGFFLMVESSQIDWMCHAKDANGMLKEMKDFNKAIEVALQFAARDRETLVIVTADHETGGVSIVEGSKMNKPEIEFTTNGHTGSIIPVFAYGPKAELFRGIYENTDIHYKMKSALGLSEN